MATDLDNDPQIQAEEKKSRIWHLKLERWKEIAAAISFFLHTFRTEALSLVSGVGTLVVGYFKIKHVITHAGMPQQALAGLQVQQRENLRVFQRQETKDLAEVPRVPATPLLADPLNYFVVALPMIFVWSAVVLWFKKRKPSIGVKP